jgi:hypothetical protein
MRPWLAELKFRVIVQDEAFRFGFLSGASKETSTNAGIGACKF